MKKYITLAALLAAGTVFANASVMFDLSGFEGKTTGASVTATIGETTDTLTMTISGGKSWKTDISALSAWANTEALNDLNKVLGLSITASGINQYAPYGCGQGSSTTSLSLDINSLDVGTQIVLYTLVTSAANNAPLSEFSIRGLADGYEVEYAAWNGNGFSSTATFCTPSVDGEGKISSYAYTLVKVTGTLTEGTDNSPLALDLSTTNGKKNLWGMIAYTAIPEPSAFGLLAGLGALALVGTRRRRK